MRRGEYFPDFLNIHEVPDGQVVFKTAPLTGKRGSGVKVELIWNFSQSTDKELKKLLESGGSRLGEFLAEGGLRSGRIVLRQTVDSNSEDLINEAQNGLWKKLDDLIKEAKAGTKSQSASTVKNLPRTYVSAAEAVRRGVKGLQAQKKAARRDVRNWLDTNED